MNQVCRVRVFALLLAILKKNISALVFVADVSKKGTHISQPSSFTSVTTEFLSSRDGVWGMYQPDVRWHKKSILTACAASEGKDATLEVTVTEEKEKNAVQEKEKGKKKKQAPAAPNTVIDISKLDIRVGIIRKAWEHEEADKLFCEEIDIGEVGGPRQIASGLKAHYSLEDLEGQRVLVLANLKSRKLMGFPSHGMVLCAATEDGSEVRFVEPPVDAIIGERVTVDGYSGEPATENQVIKKKMLNAIFPDLKTDREGTATYKGTALSTSSGVCIAQNGLKNVPIA